MGLPERKFIPAEEMYFDKKFIGPQEKHNWLFATEKFEVTSG
jgi:hypothetical protein